MQVRLIAYGIAREIVQTRELQLEIPGPTIGQLREELMARYPTFGQLRSLSFAVNEAYRDDGYALQDDDEVVIIPPVSGG